MAWYQDILSRSVECLINCDLYGEAENEMAVKEPNVQWSCQTCVCLCDKENQHGGRAAGPVTSISLLCLLSPLYCKRKGHQPRRHQCSHTHINAHPRSVEWTAIYLAVRAWEPGPPCCLPAKRESWPSKQSNFHGWLLVSAALSAASVPRSWQVETEQDWWLTLDSFS